MTIELGWIRQKRDREMGGTLLRNRFHGTPRVEYAHLKDGRPNVLGEASTITCQ